MWLFRNQRKRFVSLDQDLILDEVKTDSFAMNGVKLLNWEATSLLDKNLVDGVLPRKTEI